MSGSAVSVGRAVAQRLCGSSVARSLGLVLTALVALTPAPAQAALDTVGETPIVVGTSFRVTSEVLGETRELNIRLPAGYGRDGRTYPVLYVLDGGLTQDFEHLAGLAQLADISGTFGPFIVVGVQTKTRRAELTSPPLDPRYRTAFPEAGGAARFRRHLSEEVIPWVEARYRTEPRRTVLGESLAGLFVVDTLLHAPRLFDDYVAISPSLWWDDRRDLRDLTTGLDPEAFRGRRLFLAMADEGGVMQSGADLLRRGLASAAGPQFELVYSERRATDTHATILHGAALDALRRFYPAPQIDYGPTPWFLIEGASPPSP